MRIKAALFPYTPSLFPAVAHFEDLQEQYSICKLISPPCYAMEGKDAGYLINVENIGITVESCLDADSDDWKTLLAVETLEDNDSINEQRENFIGAAIEAGKTVCYITDSKDTAPGFIKRLKEQHPKQIMIRGFQKINSAEMLQEERKIVPISAPVILCGGLIEEADVFASLVSLDVFFKRRGIRALMISKQSIASVFGYFSFNHIWNDKELTEAKKTEYINAYLSALEKKIRPDVIVLEAPDAMLTYCAHAPNGFGIRTFMLLQASKVDFLFFCVPCEYASSDAFLQAIDGDFERRFGKGIDAVHISGVIIDTFDTNEKQEISIVRTSLLDTDRYVAEAQRRESPFKVYNAYRQKQAEHLYQELFEELSVEEPTVLPRVNMSRCDELLRLLEERFFVAKKLLSKDFWNVPLTGDPFHFSSSKLLLLFLEIEKLFQIRIESNRVSDYGFNTISGILYVINEAEKVDFR